VLRRWGRRDLRVMSPWKLEIRECHDGLVRIENHVVTRTMVGMYDAKEVMQSSLL
jgi:hypothetical protein